MSLSDSVGDMLTRIRNGSRVGAELVEAPRSREKEAILAVLKREGFISDYRVDEGKRMLVVRLKYGKDGKPAISSIRRVSKPGLRRYTGAKEMPRVLGGMGILVLNTSAGVMSDREARKNGVGGEIVCAVH